MVLPQDPGTSSDRVSTATTPDSEPRRWYIFNHMMPLGVVSTLTFYVFGMEVKELSERGQVSFTLLLTVMAAKFVLADHLPKIAFLTVIDYYILSCFFMARPAQIKRGLVCAARTLLKTPLVTRPAQKNASWYVQRALLNTTGQ